jgi:hypothetical protein
MEKVTDVWIVAGDEALHPGFYDKLKEASITHGWSVDGVKLPVNMVVHTGVAISQLLFCLDADSAATGVYPLVHCAVSEAMLKQWPKCVRGAHKSRLDNVNSCLRCFGVDGGSTRQMENDAGTQHSGEFLVRSSLKTFMMLGDGPIGRIDTNKYRRRLTWLQKRALSDENFLEELVFAGLSQPQTSRNGMTLMYDRGGELMKMFQTMVEVSGLGKNVLVLVLDPKGRKLM